MRISDWSSDVCSSDLQIFCCKCPIKLVCFFKRSRQVAARNRRASLEHAPGGFLRFSAGRSREDECQGQMRNDSNELSGECPDPGTMAAHRAAFAVSPTLAGWMDKWLTRKSVV